jgi:hypothetical protein
MSSTLRAAVMAAVAALTLSGCVVYDPFPAYSAYPAAVYPAPVYGPPVYGPPVYGPPVYGSVGISIGGGWGGRHHHHHRRHRHRW